MIMRIKIKYLVVLAWIILGFVLGSVFAYANGNSIKDIVLSILGILIGVWVWLSIIAVLAFFSGE